MKPLTFMWLKKQPASRVEPRRESEFEFIGEQDGATERALKLALAPILKKYQVMRAYLARVRTGAVDEVSVCLCLIVDENKNLVNDVAEVFGKLFGSHEHLDIIFLTGMQESKVAGICQAFYSATSSTPARGLGHSNEDE